MLDLINDLGAIGDGTLRPLSERFATLSEAQDVYPEATSLAQSIDWAALQKGINQGVGIFVPANTFIINSSVIVNSNAVFLYGDNSGATLLSTIRALSDFGAGPMFHYDGGYIDFDNQKRDNDRNLSPSSPTPAGTGLVLNISSIKFEHFGVDHAGVFMFAAVGAGSKFNQCDFVFGSGRGVVVGTAFGITMDTCRFRPNYADDEGDDDEAYKRMGLYAASHITVLNCDFNRCGVGLVATGTAVNLFGGRFEVNMYGLVLGDYPNLGWDLLGTPTVLSRSQITGCHFEQNRYGIQVNACFLSRLGEMGILGTSAPSGLTSRIGLEINNANPDTEISNITANGTFTNASIIYKSNYQGTATNLIGDNNPQGLTVTDGAVVSVFGAKGGSPNLPLDYDYKGQHRGVRLQAKATLSHRGLTGLALDKSLIFCKNFGGTETLTEGEAAHPVAFTNIITPNQASFNGPLQVIDDPCSMLEANNYEYGTSLLNRLGETGVDNIVGTNPSNDTLKGVTVVLGKKVVLNFFSNPGASLRRVYRRVAGSGSWDGYFEIPTLTIVKKFEDNGQAFDGFDIPPTQDSIVPSAIEDNVDYEVILTPSWMTSARVFNKKSTGFDMEFSTAAPANASVAWLMFRP